MASRNDCPPDLLLWTGLPIGVGLALSAWLPVELTLPVLSAVLILAAVVTALLARSHLERWEGREVTFRDLSGFLAFLGIAAGLLADPEDVLPILQREAFGPTPPPARH